MNIHININGRRLRAKKGDYLLDVCRENGIRVPTLCSLPGFSPTGACRLCVVEIDSQHDLVPACSYPVTEEITVKTHSPRVIRARKTIVELLLSSHPDDCMYCSRSSNCELQALAEELSVGERKVKSRTEPGEIDNTSRAISHNPDKCILCGRCIRVCDSLNVSALEFVGRGAGMEVGTVMGQGLKYSSCISCGQCLLVCPTGSLQENNDLESLLAILQDQDNSLSALIDPALESGLAEVVGVRSPKGITGLLIQALKTIGFQKVYSGAEAIDLSLAQTSLKWDELSNASNKSWYMTSSCPAWTNYIEQIRPEWIKHLLPVHTPPIAFARIFRGRAKEVTDEHLKNSSLIYFTTCVASKEEVCRKNRMENGRPLIDLVITSSELMQLLRLYGIQLDNINPSAPDVFLRGIPNSHHLASVSGGYLESLYNLYKESGRASENQDIKRLRAPKSPASVEVIIDKQKQNWISTSKISEALETISSIERESGPSVLIEVMACPSGCISGGGQFKPDNEKSLRTRIKSVLDQDRDGQGLNQDKIKSYLKEVADLESSSFKFREVHI